MANPKIQLRHDTSTNWQTQNPVLLEGEVAIETDSNKVKIGNGTDNYNTLPYITDQTKIDLDYSNADYQPVDKAGDTMTGNLTILKDNGAIIEKTSFDSTTATEPSTYLNLGTFAVYDTNDKLTGYIQNYFNVGNIVGTQIGARRIVNGVNKSSALYLMVDVLGNASCNFPNTRRCDGQWKNINQAVVDVVTSLNGSSSLPYTLNIPNDGHHHMVLLFAEGDTGNASSNLLNIKIGSDICGYITVCRNRTRTASSVALGGCVMLPVGSSNKIYVQRSSGWNGNLTSLYAAAYRRIGYNE